MKHFITIIIVSFVALLNVSGHCQEITTSPPQPIQPLNTEKQRQSNTIKLIEQEAAKQHIVISPSQLNARIAEISQRINDEFPGGMDAYVTQRYLSLAEFQRQMGIQLELEMLIAQTLPPASSPITRFHIRHILILTANPNSKIAGVAQFPHTDTEALTLIAQAQAELKAGNNFAEVAAKYTEDPSGKGKGGDLGLLDTTTNFDPDFLKAALALKPGEVTATPAKSIYGYHLIYMQSSSVAPLPEDANLYVAAAEADRRRQMQRAIPAYIQKLRDDSKVSVEFHEGSLNRAFRLTAEELNQAIDKGKQLAKQGKKWDDVYKTVSQMPRGVKGEKGKSHESAVYCTTLNAIDMTAAAYKAANNYDPLPPRYTHDGYAKQIHFFVSLVSVPKVGATVFDSNRTAGNDDVQVKKFVLTDDKGNVINPVDTTSAEGVQSGTMDFSGVNSIRHTDTSQTNANANVYAYDSDGNSANAYGTGSRTTTRTWTEYLPWSESHPYFSATYNVDFPLFDANGQPLIKTDAKSITLHIITPNGEKQVTYDLVPPKI